MAAKVTPARAQVPRAASTLPTSCRRAAATTSARPTGSDGGSGVGQLVDGPAGHADGVAAVRARHPLPQRPLPGEQVVLGPALVGFGWPEGQQGAEEAAGEMAERSELTRGGHGGIGSYPRPGPHQARRPARTAASQASPGLPTAERLLERPKGWRASRRLTRYRVRHGGLARQPTPSFPTSTETVMPKPLVIVESPAKAKTISSLLGSDYHVESSIGHIRDLPRNAADVPPAYKGESWARLGVDVDNDFKPLYVVSREKRDQVQEAQVHGQGRQRALPRHRRGS